MKLLTIVGLGPGEADCMTVTARRALEEAEVLVGYSTYIDLIRSLYPEKELVDTGMTREVDRCKKALEIADADRRVAVVCSGDAGVYGMSGLVYELSVEFPQVEIRVVPGVTAALSGGAVLGAPLTHDFAVISLSDLLTPWELIEKRLDCAGAGDFCIALYNPGSKTRKDYLQRACDILLRHKSGETVCGIVRNIGRDGELAVVTTLSALRDTPVDMFTTVFIGNAMTRVIGGKMVTPRGYRLG